MLQHFNFEAVVLTRKKDIYLLLFMRTESFNSHMLPLRTYSGIARSAKNVFVLVFLINKLLCSAQTFKGMLGSSNSS